MIGRELNYLFKLSKNPGPLFLGRRLKAFSFKLFKESHALGPLNAGRNSALLPHFPHFVALLFLRRFSLLGTWPFHYFGQLDAAPSLKREFGADLNAGLGILHPLKVASEVPIQILLCS